MADRKNIGVVQSKVVVRASADDCFCMASSYAWLFRTFSGSWPFVDVDSGCEVTFRYRFDCRPTWLQRVTHPVGRWHLGRDIDRRLAAFTKGVEDPVLLSRARAEMDGDPPAAES